MNYIQSIKCSFCQNVPKSNLTKHQSIQQKLTKRVSNNPHPTLTSCAAVSSNATLPTLYRQEIHLLQCHCLYLPEILLMKIGWSTIPCIGSLNALFEFQSFGGLLILLNRSQQLFAILTVPCSSRVCHMQAQQVQQSNSLHHPTLITLNWSADINSILYKKKHFSTSIYIKPDSKYFNQSHSKWGELCLSREFYTISILHELPPNPRQPAPCRFLNYSKLNLIDLNHYLLNSDFSLFFSQLT